MLDAFVKAIRERHGLVPTVQKVHGIDRLLNPQPDGSFQLEDLDAPLALATPLQVTTLSAVVDYVKSPDHPRERSPELVVHVRSAESVAVSSRILDSDFAQRETYLVANVENLVEQEVEEDDDETFALSHYVDHETFIVALLARFADTPSRTQVLDLVGAIRGERVHESTDSGYTQTVTVRKGVHLVSPEGVPIKNPVTLAPFRTFRQIAQPASPFILRGKDNPGGEKPLLALFEADGGAWRVQAIAAIKAFLTEQLGDVDGVTILA